MNNLEILKDYEACALLRVGIADLKRCQADPLWPGSLTRANLVYWTKLRIVKDVSAFLGIPPRIYRRLLDLDPRLPRPIVRTSGPRFFVKAELEHYQDGLI